jgi:hypothetical protein
MLQVLQRKRKNNPVLLDSGETRRWKIVAETTRRMAVGDAPDLLCKRQVIALDYEALLAKPPDGGRVFVDVRLRSLFADLREAKGTLPWNSISEISNVMLESKDVANHFLRRRPNGVSGTSSLARESRPRLERCDRFEGWQEAFSGESFIQQPYSDACKTAKMPHELRRTGSINYGRRVQLRTTKNELLKFKSSHSDYKKSRQGTLINRLPALFYTIDQYDQTL